MLMTDPDVIRRFVLAGRATFTISSLKTGARYTYRASKCDANNPMDERYFVALLTGPDNEGDFTYLGLLNAAGTFTLTKRSRMTAESAPVRAAQFFCEKVLRDGIVPNALEVRHEGRCGKCNRKLTVPESIDNGIGPECARFV
jgi:hypothetical protein